MNAKNLLGILFLSISAIHVFAQQSDTSYKTISVDISVDTVYNKTIDYLQNNGYFILSLEKQSGFIQAKMYIKNSKLLTSKLGERRFFNFIIRPAAENQTEITLNIYSERLTYFKDSCYYEDKGVNDDATLYKSILEGLREYL